MFAQATTESESTGMLSAFTSSWATIKTRLAELRDLGATIASNLARYRRLAARSLLPAQQGQVQAGLGRTIVHQSTWQQVMAKINQYLPSWRSQEQAGSIEGKAGLQGLGIVQIVLGAAAITALAVVASVGLKLLKDVYTEKANLDRLEGMVASGALTSGQALPAMTKLMTPAQGGLISIGGMTLGLPMLLLGGAAAWWVLRRRAA